MDIWELPSRERIDAAIGKEHLAGDEAIDSQPGDGRSGAKTGARCSAVTTSVQKHTDE